MKKIISILLVLAMVLVSAGCGSEGNTVPETNEGTAGTYTVTLWVDSEIAELTKTQIDEFNNVNKNGIVIDADVQSVGCIEAAELKAEDPSGGADLFLFTQDQLPSLKRIGALSELPAGYGENIASASDSASVKSASLNDVVCAYPVSADGGYIMYYDKSVVQEIDVDSLENIIADCESAGRCFAMDVNMSAFYLSSFFFGTGCTSEWGQNESGRLCSINDNFDSEEGLIALKGLKKLLDADCFLSSSDPETMATLSGVLIAGKECGARVEEILGENMGAADLPSFTENEISYHLGSFFGGKLMGVRPSADSDINAACHALASYLCSESCQTGRYNEAGWVPACLGCRNEDAIKEDKVLSAFFAQEEYAVPQRPIHPSWWNAASHIAADTKGAIDDEGLQNVLHTYSEAVQDIIEEEQAAIAAEEAEKAAAEAAALAENKTDENITSENETAENGTAEESGNSSSSNQ